MRYCTRPRKWLKPKICLLKREDMITRTFHVLYREFQAPNESPDEQVLDTFDTYQVASARLQAEYFQECARLSERYHIIDSWCSRFYAKIVLADGDGIILYKVRAEDLNEL